MEKSPKVSVIIPAYNRRDFVTEAIDSALNQTYRDFEVIVVDDGSTDGTGEMLKERYDDKIRYFYKENGGCASARNYGIKMARGEYIAFLDSDDRYLPEKLEDQVGILEKNNRCGFVSSDVIFFDDGKEYLFKTIRPDKNGDIAYPIFMFTYFSLCASVFRKSCFDKVGYFNETMRYNEDTDMLLRVAINFKAEFSYKPTFLYRVHKEGKSTNAVNLLHAVYESSVNVFKLYPDFKINDKKINKRLARIKLDLSMEYIMQRDFEKAVNELNLSLWLYKTLRKRLYLYLLRKRWTENSIIWKAMSFAEWAIKIVQWNFYKCTGWV